MTSHLRDLIANAENAIDTYRYPDVDECQERLNELLVAAGLGSIERDRLAYISIKSGKVLIRTEYSVRGCEQSDDYEFPEAIIDAANPVYAATLWGLSRRESAARYELEEARRILAHREKEHAKALAALAEFGGLSTPPQTSEA